MRFETKDYLQLIIGICALIGIYVTMQVKLAVLETQISNIQKELDRHISDEKDGRSIIWRKISKD